MVSPSSRREIFVLGDRRFEQDGRVREEGKLGSNNDYGVCQNPATKQLEIIDTENNSRAPINRGDSLVGGNLANNPTAFDVVIIYGNLTESAS